MGHKGSITGYVHVYLLEGSNTSITVRSIECPIGCDVDGRWAGRVQADHNSSTAHPASVQPPSCQRSTQVLPTGGQWTTHNHAW